MWQERFMDKRFTILIYGDKGSFVRLRLFSKKVLKTAGVISVGCALLLAFILCDYAYLKYSSSQTKTLKKDFFDLKSELSERDKQIEVFYSKIDSLQMDLVKLNQLERNLRMYTGIYKNMKNLDDFGIGGMLPDGADDRVASLEYQNKFIKNMENKVDQLDRAVDDQSEEFHILWETLRELKKIQDSTPSIRPIEGGWISSKFGFRKSPFTGKREFHSGLDIANHEGTPVLATADGVVSYTGYKGLLGKSIFISHGFGIRTRYGHLSQFHVEKGQKVKRGDIIGEVGSTGRSTGPHLHYEVRLNDIPVNAEKYISEYLASNNPS